MKNSNEKILIIIFIILLTILVGMEILIYNRKNIVSNVAEENVDNSPTLTFMSEWYKSDMPKSNIEKIVIKDKYIPENYIEKWEANITLERECR